MKILLTGGGTGGHFYPLIAVAREVVKIAREKHIIEPEFVFASDAPYDEKVLEEEDIRFLKLPAGKIRRYFSLLNFLSPFKTLIGVILGILKVYKEMPDVIFSKGGYASLPVIVASRLLKISLIFHESDIIPGKVHSFVKKSAKRIAVSFAETAKYFDKSKTALTGNPIRKGILGGNFETAKEMFGLKFGVKEGKSFFTPPVLLVLGSSQGARKINEIILETLPELTKKYQIIHQCGVKNFKETEEIAGVILKNSDQKDNYHIFGFLSESEYREAARAADLIISRASAGAIFEIAAWGKPSILIPLSNSAQNHQRENAWNYAGQGAAEVIEEENFTPHIFLSEIKNIMDSHEKQEKMARAALEFAKPDAARKIAEEIINLALEHAD